MLGGIILLVSLLSVRWSSGPGEGPEGEGAAPAEAAQPTGHLFDAWVGKPGGWVDQPLEAFGGWQAGLPGLQAVLGSGLLLGVGCTLAMAVAGHSAWRFARAFLVIFLLASLAYLLAGQAFVKTYNLEYALWALAVALAIANTVGVPEWLRPAVQTEFYIKTGLVLLGSEILLSRLLALGLPGVFVAWVVTPIVLISTFWFGQRVLKIQSPSLNMVISADMSVCGVSAAIASAAACRAKKEELSLAIGMSLSFTVVMMVVMPAVIGMVGMDEVLAGAWMGGTIDATGAVAAAGELVGERALEVAATIKMIQNILIGVVAFGIAVFWSSVVDRRGTSQIGWGEVWKRFPKFILGFIAASVLFSALYSASASGPAWTSESIGVTKVLRGWLFCLAFVSIGLETNFAEIRQHLRGGKPLVLYLCGQSLNLVLTLAMAYLMFYVVFPDAASVAGR